MLTLSKELNPRMRAHIGPLFFLLALYTLSRVYFENIGITMISFQWITQNIDRELMHHHLLESVFYDHYQPPLVNLVPGFFVKFFGDRYWVMATVFYDILSVLIIIELYFIFYFLKIRNWIGLVLISLLILNPSFLYYEKMLFYHHPVVFLFSTSIFCLLAFIRYKKLYWLYIFFFSLCAIIYYRTSFTIYWFVACVIIVGWLLKNWKVTIRAALIPLILVLALYLKNLIVFGFWGGSTISGASMWLLTHFAEKDVKETMISDHKVSPLFNYGLWSDNVDDFKPYLSDTAIPDKFKDISVLNDKRSNNTKSSHHFYMIEVQKKIGADSKKVIFESPITMLKVFVYGLYVYFYPTGDYVLNNPNLGHNITFNKLYNRVILWQLSPPGPKECFSFPVPEKATDKLLFKDLFASMKFEKVSFSTILLYIILLIWGLRFVIVSTFNKVELSTMDKVKFFTLIQMGYIFALYTTFTTMENNRLRNESMTLGIILIGIIANEAFEFIQSKAKKDGISK
jgi:hypothetical protein